MAMNARFLMLLDGIGEGWLDTTMKKRKEFLVSGAQF
jgi:hypothetical protein